MIVDNKRPSFWAVTTSISLILFGILFGAYSFSIEEKSSYKDLNNIPVFSISQENTLIGFSNPENPPLKVVKKLPVVVTAYSSTPSQTDDSPYITASGTWVKDGIVANNMLPFGTKIRIPELYGDKVFVVEDRMNWKKGNYMIDVWVPDYSQALAFGAKRTHIEVLE